MKKGLHFIVLTTFLVGVLAPACGFSWGPNGGGQYSVVEICTTQGIESRVVQNEEEPTNNPINYEEQCQFCFSSANLNALIPDLQAFETHLFVFEKARFHDYEIILLSRLTHDHAARAPPVFI